MAAHSVSDIGRSLDDSPERILRQRDASDGWFLHGVLGDFLTGDGGLPIQREAGDWVASLALDQNVSLGGHRYRTVLEHR